jgi:hypothetical protein
MPAKRKKGREEHDDGVEKMVIGGNYHIFFVLVVFVILSREEKTRHWTDHTEPKPCDSAIFWVSVRRPEKKISTIEGTLSENAPLDPFGIL